MISFLYFAFASSGLQEKKGRLSSFSNENKVMIEKSNFNKVKTDFQGERAFYIKTEEGINISEVIGRDKQVEKFRDKFSADLTGKEVSELQNLPGIIIEEVPIYRISLQDSVPLINATKIWTAQQGGFNLTGKGETVCVIDTGIDYNHVDLGGCYGNNNANSNCKVIGGYDYVNNDENPIDDNGHGTHVAGIATANGKIKGVAPDARLIAMKVCNSGGGCAENKIANGIEWCINRSQEFNISIISMSLGSPCGVNDTSGCYTGYCNSDTLATDINNATRYNISVVVASGNGDSGGAIADAISSPACVENATPVASTNKADTNISTFADTWNNKSLLILAAPGESINSTWYDGSYAIESGTSMATPHVSGAIAIIKQYLKITSQQKTTNEIRALLNNTGKQIYDGYSTRNFSRIDIFSAIYSLDNQPPNVTLNSPANGTQILSTFNQTFRCSATDISLRNVTFYLWNSTSTYNITSQNVSGEYASFEVNLTNIPKDNYNWNCFYTDEKNQRNFSASNNTIVLNPKQVILIVIDGLQFDHLERMINNGSLSNFSSVISGRGMNASANITGHVATSTAPGNAEIHTGLNMTFTGITDNTPKTLPLGNTTFERLKVFDSSIKTGWVYGKYTTYIPDKLLANATSSIDWKQNRTTFNSTNWIDGSACTYSENVSNKAADFISTYARNSFYLVVYFGTPDCTGHVHGENSTDYENAVTNADNGIGIILNSLVNNGLRGRNNFTQIIITADHGWNTNDTSHNRASDTIIIPFISNNVSMTYGNGSLRKQCDIAPTILNYFGLNSSDYSEITDNGCYSLIADTSPPLITINSPLAQTYTSSSISFNITTNENSTCNYTLDNGITNYTLSTGDNINFYSTQSLSNAGYTVRYYCSDLSSNLNDSENRTFTVSVTASTGNNNGGGGGGGGSPSLGTNNILTIQQTEQGVSRELKTNDKITFEIKTESGNEKHSVVLNNITDSRVNITISSNPINLILGVGQSVKLNLTSPEYYDLFVKLEGIRENRANLTIRSINEPIKIVVEEENNETPQKMPEDYGKEGNNGYWLYVIQFLIVFAIIFIVLRYLVRGKNKKHKK